MRISTSQIFQQGLNGILQQQARLSQTQLQLSTGKRINNTSDDPIGAARLQELERAIGLQDVFERNVSRSRQRLQVAESAVGSASNLVQRVRELTVQAANDSLGDDNRAQIARELRQRLDQLLGIANTRDGDGEFIFAGAQVRSQPFVVANGEVRFVGDSVQRELSIAPAVTLRDGETGDRVFMNLRDGNGLVRAELSPGNTGSGRILVGAATNPTAYGGESFTIRFLGPDSVAVLDQDGVPLPGFGALVPDPVDPGLPPVLEGVPFSPGDTLAFSGLSFTIQGTPAADDEFTVGPARNESIFATLGALIDTLEARPVGDAARAVQRQGIDNALAQLERIEGRLLEVRSDFGGRQNTLDSIEDSLADQKLSLESRTSEIRDLDYAEAITRLQQELVTLQAAQQSFIKTQGLSLFNFLR